MIGFHWTWTKRSGGLQMGWSLKTVTNGTEVANEEAFHETTMCLPEEASPTHGIRSNWKKPTTDRENAPNSGFRESRSSHKLACYSGYICLSCQRGFPLHWNHFASLPKELLGFWSLLCRMPVTFLAKRRLIGYFEGLLHWNHLLLYCQRRPLLYGYWKHFCFLCRTGCQGRVSRSH